MNTMTQDSSTGLWNNKNRKIFFWSILALAVILRCIRFATVPDGINQDEAMGAVDAWALSKYGTDRYGTFLPVHFTAWRYSQMSVLLAYCMVPFIKRKRSIASTFYPPRSSAIIVSHYTQSKKFST